MRVLRGLRVFIEQIDNVEVAIRRDLQQGRRVSFELDHIHTSEVVSIDIVRRLIYLTNFEVHCATAGELIVESIKLELDRLVEPVVQVQICHCLQDSTIPKDWWSDVEVLSGRVWDHYQIAVY